MRPGSAGAQAVGRLRDYLNSVRERCTGCEALLVLDARGRAAASSAGRTAGMQLTLERLNGLQTGDALVGEAYWDAGIGKPAIVLAVPIRQTDGRFLGAFIAKLNLRSVADILQRLGPSEPRSEEHTSELQSPCNLVCRLLLEKKKKKTIPREALRVRPTIRRQHIL